MASRQLRDSERTPADESACFGWCYLNSARFATESSLSGYRVTAGFGISSFDCA